MLTKRIRSEYMKKFKDPKWDTYNKCYEDLLKYRLSRRLLEQAHNPWFWGDWGSDTESSGKTTPLRQNKVEPLMVSDETQAPAHVTAEPATGAEVENAEAAVTKLIAQKTEKPAEKGEEENVECNPDQKPENNIHITSTPKIKQRSKSKVRPCASKDTDKENRHPFALYGAGEKRTNMAAKKTHNVGPAASTSEIHESALRAKTRREVEKHMKRLDKQRARSADLEKKGSKAVPDFNPWMTEYMRCFSVRSR